MKEREHCTPGGCPGATATGEIVSIYVEHKHPLLQLKRALPWATLFEVMTRRWAAAGKNTDGRPGLPWDVSLYGPLVVLMCVKNLHAREMEAYLAENVVAAIPCRSCAERVAPCERRLAARFAAASSSQVSIPPSPVQITLRGWKLKQAISPWPPMRRPL